MLRRLERHLFPELGTWPIAEIEAPQLLDAMWAIERRAAQNSRGSNEIVHRMLQAAGQVFRYAVATGAPEATCRASARCATGQGKDAQPGRVSRDGAPRLSQGACSLRRSPTDQTRAALADAHFVRTGELRGAQWEEFELEKSQWRVPAGRLKMKSEHVVPLSTRSIDVICDLHKPNDGPRYVFGNQADHEKPMSENTMIYALYRMRYHSRATAHGFRATASTILSEQGFRPDVIERQLAHVERNKVRAAYHRTEYIVERRKMMKHWADYLDSLVSYV